MDILAVTSGTFIELIKDKNDQVLAIHYSVISNYTEPNKKNFTLL